MFLVCIDFLFQHFPSLSDHLSIYCHHSFIHRRAVALTAVAHAHSKVISTSLGLPTLSDTPQPATTNTHARSHVWRPTVEMSLLWFVSIKLMGLSFILCFCAALYMLLFRCILLNPMFHHQKCA